MTTAEWEGFCAAREHFRALCAELSKSLPELRIEQERLVAERGGAYYTIDTPVVYNTALDDISRNDAPALILVADNPGRREQSSALRRYLVGPSGKIAEHFFAREQSLNFDLRKNVIILNKTPIHTPRTVELRSISGPPSIHNAVIDSQKKMAHLLSEFYTALRIPVWVIGYSEMRKNGIFAAYTAELAALVGHGKINADDVFFYRHFSMNQFSIDLNKQRLPRESTVSALTRIGAAYRTRILQPFYAAHPS